MVNISDLLAKASKTLILEEPFYGLFLVGLNKTFRKDIPTAGVSKHGIGVQLAVQAVMSGDHVHLLDSLFYSTSEEYVVVEDEGFRFVRIEPWYQICQQSVLGREPGPEGGGDYLIGRVRYLLFH